MPGLADLLSDAYALDSFTPPRPTPEGAKLLEALDVARSIPRRGWHPEEAVPFVGSVMGAARLSTIGRSAERIGSGKATDRDYEFVAGYIAEQEAAGDMGIGEKVLAGSLGSLGIGAEMIASGGAFSLGREATEQAAIRALGSSVAARVGARAAGVAGGVAAESLATAPLGALDDAAQYAMPEVGLAETAEGLAPVIERYGDDVPAALLKGLARHGLTRAVERVGGEAIGKLPVVRQVQSALGAAWMKATGSTAEGLAARLASRAGWNGVLGELGEERVEEVLAGAVGLEGDFGLTGRAASMAFGSEEESAAAGQGFAGDVFAELGTILATGAVTAGAAQVTERTPDALAKLGEGLSRFSTMPRAVAEKIQARVPLSRKDAESLGVKGYTGAKEREALVAEALEAVKADADKLIRERPEVAGELTRLDWGRGFVTPEEFEKATGAPQQHAGYAQLLADALRGRQQEINQAISAKPRPGEAAADTDTDIDTVTEAPEPSINDLRAELKRAGIPIPGAVAQKDGTSAGAATKEELKALYDGWRQELQRVADDAEVPVELLEKNLRALYDRESEIDAEDETFQATLSEYRGRYGLNKAALERSDWTTAWPKMDEIAASFITETGGPRPGLETTEDFVELVKEGKYRSVSLRDLIPEALENAVAERDAFDQESFAEMGLPAVGTRRQPQPLPFLADRHRQSLAAAVTSSAPRAERAAAVKQTLGDLKAELAGDFESRLEGFDLSAFPEAYRAHWPRVAKIASARLAKSIVDQVRGKAAESLRLKSPEAADLVANEKHPWMPEPHVGTTTLFDAFDRLLPERSDKDAVIAKVAKALDVTDVDHFVDPDDPGAKAFREAIGPDGDGEGVQARPSLAATSALVPWAYGATLREKKPTAAPHVIRQLAKATAALGDAVPIRTGRMHNKKRESGFYLPKEHVARVQMANDVVTAAHEVGHAIDRLVHGRGHKWKKAPLPPAVRASLVKLGQDAYPRKEPHNGWESEGFAEMTMAYVMDKTRLDPHPELRDWLKTEVFDKHPEFAKRLEAASRLGHRWVKQGSYNRGRASMIDSGSMAAKRVRLARLYEQNRPYETLVEGLAPFEEMTRAAEAVLGKPVPPSKNPYKTGKALRLTAPAITRAMLEEGMIDRTGRVVGPSLKDAVRQIKPSEYHDFALYLWALRARYLTATGRLAGLSKQDAEQIIKELDNLRFAHAATQLYEWTDGVLSYLASMSPTIAQQVEAMRAAESVIDPETGERVMIGDYVPLQRFFRDIDEAWSKASATGGVARGGIAKRLKGSGLEVINPIESLIGTTQERIARAQQRAMLEQAVELARKTESLGEFIEEVKAADVPEASRTIGALLAKLKREIGEHVSLPWGAKLEMVDQFGDPVDILDALDEWVTFWAQADNPTGPDPIFAMKIGDDVKWFYVKPRLARALGVMSEGRFRDPTADAIFRFVRTTNIFFKMGTTGLSFRFGLLTNPIRDVQDLYQRTKSGASGPRVAAQFLRAYGEEFVSRLTGRAVETKAASVFRRLGLETSQYLGRERAATRRAAKGLFRTVTPGRMVDYLVDLMQFSDAAARIAEMRMTAKEKGIDLDDLSYDQAIDLAISAKEATTDFSAGGTRTWLLNGLSPYFNARVQGWRGGFRAAASHPYRTLWRMGWKSAVLAGLWLTYRDEDWWKEMPDYEKWAFLHVPIEAGGRKEVLRIPVPQDTENLYTLGVLAVIDATYRRDPETAVDYAHQLSATLLPALPVGAEETLEQIANRDFYTGKPIVSARYEDASPEFQKNEYTTGAARFLGETLGWSPMRIDHAIRGIGGPLAAGTAEVVTGTTARKGETEPADVPVAGVLFQRGGRLGYRPESVERAYELAQQTERAYKDASLGGPKETPEGRQLRLMLGDATKALTGLSHARSQAETVDERRKITEEMARIARSAVADYEAAKPKRGIYKSAAHRAARQRKLAERRALDAAPSAAAN